MRVAIVEDDRGFAEQVKGQVDTFFRERRRKAEVQCLAGGGLLEAIERRERFELCLLDVEMPGMDGRVSLWGWRWLYLCFCCITYGRKRMGNAGCGR